MRGSLFQKRIPSILGFLLVGSGIFLSSWFLQTGVLFPTDAASGTTPQNVRISNVSDTSFTVSYTTTDKVIGFVEYGTGGNLENRALDERDLKTGTPTENYTHSITVNNLKPETIYEYQINSNGKEYKKGDAPFSITTPTTLDSNGSGNFNISGKVQLADNASAIVYASLADSQVVSVLSSADGSYNISYPLIRSENLSSKVQPDPSSIVTILVMSNTGSTKISSILQNSSSLPIVSLSQNYDFSLGSTPIGSFDASSSAQIAEFPSFAVDEPGETQEPEILTPENEEGFSDQQPEFTGRGVPGTEVEISIHSDEVINTKVTTSNNGSWKFRPTTPLSPGQHTITIRTRDAFGILKEIKKSFVVYAEGSQFTEPSVSPVQRPSATPTPTVSPTRIPSLTIAVPTTGVTTIPTPTSVAITTPIPEPTIIAVAPSTPPAQIPPEAGSPVGIISGLVGVVTLSVGLFVLFISKGGVL